MIRVLHHQRHPGPGKFSLERVFRDVRTRLPDDIDARVATCAFDSRGIFRRAFNTLSSRRQEADVHHVLGDVHYLALGLDSNRTVLTIADCAGLYRLKGVRRFILWVFWYYLPIRKAKVVTAISGFTREELLRTVRCEPGKIRIIHCPLSPLFMFSPAHFQEGAPTILQVGTGPTKNVERVVEALKAIPCHLSIIGNLSPKQQQVLDASRIAYRNYPQVSDNALLRLYVGSDLVIFASTYEGFGLPIIEAQAVGRPVIASERASLPEVAGNAAEFVNPDDHRSIRDAVRRLISDASRRERLVALGRENVKRFEPNGIAEEYASIYREVATS
jgi:glycosyltransferase involved in cell wall biosynthesis